MTAHPNYDTTSIVKTDAWGMGKWAKDFGRFDPSKPVRVSFGEPVHISGNGKTEHRSTTDFIGSKLDGWRSKAKIRCPKSEDRAMEDGGRETEK